MRQIILLIRAQVLSIHVWALKDKMIDYAIKWEIIDRAPIFNPVTGVCCLCVLEKYYIIFNPLGASLNKNNEVYKSCPHKRFMLLDKTQFQTLFCFVYGIEFLVMLIVMSVVTCYCLSLKIGRNPMKQFVTINDNYQLMLFLYLFHPNVSQVKSQTPIE